MMVVWAIKAFQWLFFPEMKTSSLLFAVEVALFSPKSPFKWSWMYFPKKSFLKIPFLPKFWHFLQIFSHHRNFYLRFFNENLCSGAYFYFVSYKMHKCSENTKTFQKKIISMWFPKKCCPPPPLFCWKWADFGGFFSGCVPGCVQILLKTLILPQRGAATKLIQLRFNSCC